MKKTAKIATCIIGAIAIAAVSAGITYKIAASPDSAGKSDALDVILTRTSIRDYQQGKPIESGKIDTLLRAGMAAPTAVNKQPWSFIVVDRPELLKDLADSLPNASMTAKAAAAIVVCGDMTKTLEGEAAEFWIQDTSAASENILLAAHAMGLGAVWTGVYPDKGRIRIISEALSLPSHIVPLCLIPVGYPAKAQEPKDKWKPENVHYNGWTD